MSVVQFLDPDEKLYEEWIQKSADFFKKGKPYNQSLDPYIGIGLKLIILFF